MIAVWGYFFGILMMKKYLIIEIKFAYFHYKLEEKLIKKLWIKYEGRL